MLFYLQKKIIKSVNGLYKIETLSIEGQIAIDGIDGMTHYTSKSKHLKKIAAAKNSFTS